MFPQIMFNLSHNINTPTYFITYIKHFSCYGPAIAIVRGMKLGVAKRRIGTNSFVLIMYRDIETRTTCTSFSVLFFFLFFPLWTMLRCSTCLLRCKPKRLKTSWISTLLNSILNLRTSVSSLSIWIKKNHLESTSEGCFLAPHNDERKHKRHVYQP